MLDKKQLRRHLREARDGDIGAADRTWYTNHDWPPEFLAIVGKARCVGSYMPVRGEVDLTPLSEVIWNKTVTLALPYIPIASARMEFREYHRSDELMLAQHKFLQPLACAPLAQPDVILIPLVGFDRMMNRIGQGAGHYDRFLADNPAALRIGIGWSIQETSQISPDPWDMPLDAVLSEREWIEGVQSRIYL